MYTLLVGPKLKVYLKSVDMNLGIQHKTQTIHSDHYPLMSPVSPVCHTEVTVNKIIV